MGCPGIPLLRPWYLLLLDFGSFPSNVIVLAASPISYPPRTECLGDGPAHARPAVSCEFNWPSFSGSVLSNFVLILHDAVSPWTPAKCVRRTRGKCLGSQSPCTSCLDPWIPPMIPVHPFLPAPLSSWPLAQDTCPTGPDTAEGGPNSELLPGSPVFVPFFPPTMADGSCHLCHIPVPFPFPDTHQIV